MKPKEFKAAFDRKNMEDLGYIPGKDLPVDEMHKPTPMSEEFRVSLRMAADKKAEQRRFWERRDV